MANAKMTVNVYSTDPRNVITQAGTTSAKIRRFAKMLIAIICGQYKRTTVEIGTAAASVTATLVAPVATNVLTLNGQAVTAIQLHARGTAIFDTIVEDNVLTVEGIDFTAKTAADAASYTEFTIGADDTAAVVACVAKINAHPDLVGVVDAVATTGGANKTVSLRAYAAGTAGNAITLAATGVPITVSDTTLLLGAAKSGNQWDYGDTATQGATSLAYAINNSATALIVNHFTATSAAGVVTVAARQMGTIGNAYTVAKTGAPITLAGDSSGRFTGGTTTSKAY